MPSNAEFMAGETSLVTEDQLKTSGMDTQDLKCSCSPSHILHKADGDTKNGNTSKKRSRKHQRFTARRALEQNDQKVLVKMDFFKVSPVQTLEGESKQCSHLLMEDSTKGQKKLDLHSLITPVSLGREPVKNPASLQGFKDRESLPNGSSTGSSSCPGCRKPRKCVAIDCEMVGTGPNGRTSELARCTVVNYDGDVIYDKYIRPELPVADYRTRWSGVTWQHLQNACPFRVAQGEIVQILRDKIVVGHAIHNDFRALKYFHPQAWTRDTSRCPLLNKQMGLSEKASVSLKNLACQLLQKKIQVGKRGHSSVEDAQTSMELYRLVEVPWEQMLSSSLLFCLPMESDTESDSFMDDRYWPKDLDIDCK